MNNFPADTFIELLEHMAASQRMIEKHLAVIRENMVVLGMRDNLNNWEKLEEVWDDESVNIAVERNREGIKNDID